VARSFNLQSSVGRPAMSVALNTNRKFRMDGPFVGNSLSGTRMDITGKRLPVLNGRETMINNQMSSSIDEL